jgi:hypothetical protein
LPAFCCFSFCNFGVTLFKDPGINEQIPLNNIFYFRYQFFVLQASSLRRNPCIRIAGGSKKKGRFEKANVVAIRLICRKFYHYKYL